MRKTIVTALLILFTASQAGYYFVYRYQQNKIQQEVMLQIKNNVRQQALQVIILQQNARDICWKEEGKEFILHGELYDVAEIKTVNGKSFLYCINDNKEEKLLQQFAAAVKSATDNNPANKGSKAEYKFQISDLYSYSSAEKILTIDFYKENKYILFISPLPSSVKKVNAPPPRA